MRVIDSPSGKYNGPANVLVCVLHHTAGGLASALATLWGYAEVSIQFLLAKNGDVYYGVRVGKRAWHCGRSRWNGQHDGYGSVNGLSVGVEIENRGDGTDDYPPEQLAGLDFILADLLPSILGRLVPNTRHRDISLEGKIDPSDNFPWHLYQDINQVLQRYTKQEVEMADIEVVPLIKEQAAHPRGAEVYAMFMDESLENNWLFVGYPHYAPGTPGADGEPQPDRITAVAFVTDMNGVVKWREAVELGKGVRAEGKDLFYHVWRMPELGQGRVQVDYDHPGLGCLPYLRRIRVK